MQLTRLELLSWLHDEFDIFQNLGFDKLIEFYPTRVRRWTVKLEKSKFKLTRYPREDKEDVSLEEIADVILRCSDFTKNFVSMVCPKVRVMQDIVNIVANFENKMRHMRPLSDPKYNLALFIHGYKLNIRKIDKYILYINDLELVSAESIKNVLNKTDWPIQFLRGTKVIKGPLVDEYDTEHSITGK